MAATSSHGGTLAGTAGGTLLTVVASLHTEDVMKTVILAGIGAVTSFLISILMKWIMKKARLLR